MALLEIKNLVVGFNTHNGHARVIDGLDLAIEKGEILAIVGESGSGKSVTAMAMMGLLPKQAQISQTSQIVFEGENILAFSPQQWRELRGKSIAMIFQDPMSSLDPCYTVGEQIIETILAHKLVSRTEARQQCLALLAKVKLNNPEHCMQQYPHQLSGGMCQRIMIAMALSSEPRLLIADEPTTALDVTIQAQILVLLQELNQQMGITIILITHDLGVVAELCQRVLVMYAGGCVEQSSTEALFEQPRHPYTQGLMNSRPTLDRVGNALIPIEGNPPDLAHRENGCQFAVRCDRAMPRCNTLAPTLKTVADAHQVACFLLEPAQ